MPGAFVSHGWLPAVVPAHARRFRLHDAALAYTLESAGADLVSNGADVEIGCLEDLTGDAPVAVVPLNANIHESHSRAQQIARRVFASAEVRVRAARARATLERRGYKYVQLVPWDRDQPIHMGGERQSVRRRAAERFPRRVLVVAHREPPAPTVLEQALIDAEPVAGVRLAAVKPLVGSGTLVVLTAGHVLRVAIGPAAGLIRMQARALRALTAAHPAQGVASRAPDILGTGHAGLARWSLERRLPGAHPAAALSAALATECVEFLVALYRTPPIQPAGREPRAVRQAEFVTAYLPVTVGDAIRDLAHDIEAEVGALRTGFWHGDFWMNNMLVDGDRLVGVIDWSQGGPHGLPLIDLLNLELIQAVDPDVYHWGAAVVEYLLPMTARGLSTRSQDYLRRTGLEIAPRQLHCLIAAYWLERVAYQLGAYLDRSRDEWWLRRNVVDVARALSASPFTRAAVHRRATPMEKIAS